MSKKPKQTRHRIPTEALELRSDPITERYQVEVDSSVNRLEKRWHSARKALEHAERKAEHKREKLEELEAAAARTHNYTIAGKNGRENGKENGKGVDTSDSGDIPDPHNSRHDLENRHRDTQAKCPAQTRGAKAQKVSRRQSDREVRETRAAYVTLQAIVGERRRELREIEALMLPDQYAKVGYRPVPG